MPRAARAAGTRSLHKIELFVTAYTAARARFVLCLSALSPAAALGLAGASCEPCVLVALTVRVGLLGGCRVAPCGASGPAVRVSLARERSTTPYERFFRYTAFYLSQSHLHYWTTTYGYAHAGHAPPTRRDHLTSCSNEQARLHQLQSYSTPGALYLYLCELCAELGVPLDAKVSA